MSILVLICTFGFSVSMYTISKQSYRVNTNETMEKLAKASNNTLTLTELTALAAKTVTISEAFNTFGQTSWTLFWTLFGMPELSSITIAYDEFASYYLKVSFFCFFRGPHKLIWGYLHNPGVLGPRMLFHDTNPPSGIVFYVSCCCSHPLSQHVDCYAD